MCQRKLSQFLHSRSVFNLLECDVAGSYFPSQNETKQKKKNNYEPAVFLWTLNKKQYIYFLKICYSFGDVPWCMAILLP